MLLVNCCFLFSLCDQLGFLNAGLDWLRLSFAQYVLGRNRPISSLENTLKHIQQMTIATSQNPAQKLSIYPKS